MGLGSITHVSYAEEGRGRNQITCNHFTASSWGHSLGEYNALLAAGAFDFLAGLRLVQERGKLMAQAKNGAMAAIVGLTHEKIAQFLNTHDRCRPGAHYCNVGASSRFRSDQGLFVASFLGRDAYEKA